MYFLTGDEKYYSQKQHVGYFFFIIIISLEITQLEKYVRFISSLGKKYICGRVTARFFVFKPENY